MTQVREPHNLAVTHREKDRDRIQTALSDKGRGLDGAR